MKPNAKPEPSKRHWGGSRPGAGRKSQWPAGTTLKSMRLPASLEAELKQVAREWLSGSREQVSPPKRPRRRPPTSKSLTVETADYFIAIHKDTDELLGVTLGRSMEESIGNAQAHFGKWWQDIEAEGWEVFPIAIVLPDWRGTDLGLG